MAGLDFESLLGFNTGLNKSPHSYILKGIFPSNSYGTVKSDVRQRGLPT